MIGIARWNKLDIPCGFTKYAELYEQRKITMKEFSKSIGRGESTTYRYMKLYREIKVNKSQQLEENKQEDEKEQTAETNFANLYKLVQAGFMTKKSMAKHVGVSVKLLETMIRDYENLSDY